MKIVIASDSYLPRWDGIARFLYDMSFLLCKKHEVTIIAPKFEGRRPKTGVKEILMPLSSFTVGDYTFPKIDKKAMKAAIKEADIVWTHTIGPIGKAAIMIAKQCKKKVAAYIHSVEWELFSRALGKPLIYNPVAAMTRSMVRKIYAKCDLLLLPSDETKNLFMWYKIGKRKVVTKLGINVRKFKPARSKVEAKKRLNISPSSIVVGYVGRLAHEKDLKTLVRAYQRLRDVYSDIKLILVGTGLDELKQRFSTIKGVILPGQKNIIVPYYQAMDVYVLPSLTETTSLSTLEAMACGVPVVTTPVGEASQYVKNSKNGYKFSKGNSFELSRYLKVLIEDENMRTRFGVHGRKTVKEHYSWEKAAKHIISVLTDLKK
jgi:glycosyltransferase involved in cell wall biosynthesis